MSSALVTICILGLVVFSSCKRDKCKKVTCEKGECVDGVCVCPSGYEGISCADSVNAKFRGAFTATELCTAGSDSYELGLIPEAGSLKGVRITGLWDKPNDTVDMVVDDDGIAFAIARQAYVGYEIEGEGSLGASLLSGNITYRVYQVGVSTAFDDCSLSYTNE